LDKSFGANTRSHEQRPTIRSLVHWLAKKTTDEKRDNPKKAKGLTKKISDKKEATQKMQMGSSKRPSIKKEATQKYKGAHQKDLR
jgi:hypothetical protein